MLGDEAEHERRLIVGVEIGPVHGDDELAAHADGLFDPEREQGPHIYALVAQETVDLFDRMLPCLPARLRERLTDDRNRKRRAGHPAEHPASQRADALGVQVRCEQGIEMVFDEFKPLSSRPHYSAILKIDSLKKHVARTRGKIESLIK